ncbi:carboxylate-amine ligase [Marinactinospora thermotolerans]|nr:glutamate--cysteine ligase [Marinactinospora thermotolerans]
MTIRHALPAVPTVGVEEEFLLVQPCGRLSARAPEVLGAAGAGPGEVHQEFRRCQVEAVSAVCSGAGDLLAGLRCLRRRLADSAARRGLRVAATATPVLAEPRLPPLSIGRRYARMVREYGPLASRSVTCGCHVHVAIPDRETGVLVCNHLRPWLPLLLALTANSPFGHGADAGYASLRYVLWGHWPSASPPPFFPSLDDYEAGVRGLLASRAALDRKMVYWDVRLSERHPTLEMRVCDVAPSAEEAVMVALLTRALVVMAMAQLERGRAAPRLSEHDLRAHMWRASRDGFEGACLDPSTGRLAPAETVLGRLLAWTRPALAQAGDLDHVETVSERLRRGGSGALRQRLAFARRGRLPDVVDAVCLPPTVPEQAGRVPAVRSRGSEGGSVEPTGGRAGRGLLDADALPGEMPR